MTDSKGQQSVDEYHRATAHALQLVIALAPLAGLWTDRLADLGLGDATPIFANYGTDGGGAITVGNVREARRLVDLVQKGDNDDRKCC